ncbi:MAG: hypothetical protein IT445_13000 [Phycisphaeraceae bacterium]|nr:hypothetical protein [Phycisphaeraceae bacterium]
MKRWTMLLLWSVWLGLTSVVAAQDSLLSAQRWSEDGFGLSLAPPQNAQVLDRPTGDALAIFQLVDGTQMSLFIRQSPDELSIDALKKEAARQFTLPYPSWLPMDDPHPLESVGDRAAGRLYMAVPDEKNGNWVMGHVFVLIDPYTFVNIQMTTSAAGFKDAARLFDAVIQSIAFMDPHELDKLRTEQLQAGDAWLKSINRQQMLQANPPLLWLRITRDGKDLGYMRLQCAAEQQLGLDGISVQMRGHIESDGSVDELFGDYFESMDRNQEVWSQGITRRPISSNTGGSLPGPGQPADTGTLRETAVRSGGLIQLTLESPTERRTEQNARHWQTPDVAYLSQVNRLLMGPMLPHRAMKMAFYCYNTAAGNIVLYSLSIEPILQGPQRGGLSVSVRPAPTEPLQQFIYDASGRLVEWSSVHGRVLKPSTPEELRKIWNIQ